MALYRDRREAGEQLAEALEDLRGKRDLLVLALPRGGVPVAEPVARRLGAPLDVYMVRKIGFPGQEEFAMGAVASGVVVLLNPALVERVPEEELRWALGRAVRELKEREQLSRGDRPPPDVAGRTVVLVDDGLATGSTMRAAVEALRRQGPREIIVAVPIASPESREALARGRPRRLRGDAEALPCRRALVRRFLSDHRRGGPADPPLHRWARAGRGGRAMIDSDVVMLAALRDSAHPLSGPDPHDALVDAVGNARVDVTQAVEPLERMPLWEAGEPAETYPTGL